MTAPRILVVEDERIIALHLRHQLTQLGYQVPHAVSTGEHALRRIEEGPPDLVLMDINLKGKLDGIETAAAIPSTHGIPVIYLTAYTGDGILERASATKPYGYLVKPFSERQLHAMIQVALARCRAERATRADVVRRQQAAKMQALGQLAAGMADEVNDLLTVLYDQLEVLGHHAVSEPALAEPIRGAFGEAIEKERLMKRLLDFSGRRSLMPETFPVRDMIADVTNQVRRITGDKVRTRILMADDLWKARIDGGHLARTLSNVALNACEAMPDGGSLTIEGRNAILDQDATEWRADVAPGRYVLLSVTDTGRGMSEADVERAFEPFFTTKPAGGGKGLGLSLVFAFMRQSGGHVSIDSEPNGGTTVRLYLPAALPAASDDTNPFASPVRPFSDPPQAPESGPRTLGLPSGGKQIVLKAAAALKHRGSDRFRHDAGKPDRQGDVSPVLWHKAENALFASVSIAPDQPRYRLIVEPLPKQNGWDWTVWRPGEAEETSRHGRASSVVSAMAAAEGAARSRDTADLES